MITEHPKLFKKTVTGATQIWYIESETNKYRTISGQIDGKHVTSEWTTCFGKNKGKKNETSDDSQCESEVKALYKKKLSQGDYKANITDIDTANYFKPMLAQSYADRPILDSQWKNGVYSQPKYDGMRCIITSNGMWSREGKQINSAPHIFSTVESLFQTDPTLVLDGELYNHSLKDNFNELMSIAKKLKPTSEDLEKSKNVLKYYCYDHYSDLYEDAPFGERKDKLAKRFTEARLYMLSDVVVYVPTVKVESQKELDDLFETYINLKYEGQMIRHNEPYENKRSKFLLKRKEWQDQEFEIVSFYEGEGNRSGMAGGITYKIVNSKGENDTFDSSITGGVDYYKQLWKEKDEYVGGTGTVKFFHLTPDGKPRFPTTIKLFKGKRDDI